MKPTLIVVRSDYGQVFGGYTNLDWTGDNYKDKSKSFVYRIIADEV